MASKTQSSTASTRTKDAVALIKQDHRAVEKLYREYKSERNEDQKNLLAEKICKSLEMHAKMEEKHFYPLFREKGGTKDDLHIVEAYAEHLGMKGMVKTIKNLPEGRARSALMSALMATVRHHVKEEESEILPAAEKMFDQEELAALGKRMASLSPSEKEKNTMD